MIIDSLPASGLLTQKGDTAKNCQKQMLVEM